MIYRNLEEISRWPPAPGPTKQGWGPAPDWEGLVQGRSRCWVHKSLVGRPLFPALKLCPHDPHTLTLLLLLPAVVSEVGDIIVFHVPFNCFEAGACVLLREGVCHVVDDIQVVSDSPVDVAHRPGQKYIRHRVGIGPRPRTVLKDDMAPQMDIQHRPWEDLLPS